MSHNLIVKSKPLCVFCGRPVAFVVPVIFTDALTCQYKLCKKCVNHALKDPTCRIGGAI